MCTLLCHSAVGNALSSAKITLALQYTTSRRRRCLGAACRADYALCRAICQRQKRLEWPPTIPPWWPRAPGRGTWGLLYHLQSPIPVAPNAIRPLTYAVPMQAFAAVAGDRGSTLDTMTHSVPCERH